MQNNRASKLNDERMGNSAQESALTNQYRRVREETQALCKVLETEDYGIQTVAEVSPPKWHLAHTSWFFETFVLKPYLSDYKAFHEQYARLFNSYYDSVGYYHPRPERGLLSRPTVAQVYEYREYVDSQMLRLLDNAITKDYQEVMRRTVLGLNHEQQHQELLLTDIKHIFAYNPLRPIYQQDNKPSVSKRSHSSSAAAQRSSVSLASSGWLSVEAGLKRIGFEGEGFSYDNEGPQHNVYLNDFRIANRLVSNKEFIAFIEDGGYLEPGLWHSEAWQKLRQTQWRAPLYWEQVEGEWHYMTLSGMRRVDEKSPVCHVSFFEAAAFARWAGKRLPTEAEWEVAAQALPVEGNFRESGKLQPVAGNSSDSLQQMFGDVWEWTQSPYIAYPGYKQAFGAFGEYNGKFMSSQMVLKGGSCVSPSDHIRDTYRNFFYPHERWQFSGFRLAEDV